MYKADYEDNLQKGVYLPSENIKLDRGMNEYHWPKQLFGVIKWFHFQVILESLSLHAKGENSYLLIIESFSYIFDKSL